MYQPAVIEAAHEFSFSDSLCAGSYSPLTLTPVELPHQDSVHFTPSKWLVDEEEGEEKDHVLGDTAAHAGAPRVEADPPKDHFDLVGEALYRSQLLTNEKLQEENAQLRKQNEEAELQQWKSENEKLRSEDSLALNSAKSNARLASDYLTKAAQEAESSVKQLLSGTETLRLVSNLLKSIDRISELPHQDKDNDDS
ncbi:hypothetical protein chiPu_0021069 [Chiloscyllium punctatum]|uniref:Endosome-associated-trafficking regulator 1 n=1 Tax=Chiloscyllium punctatum TaxID=137246 RepID=A0A401RMP2_CHIPU|nr:hypothetical protein [Chiloscyllium punctatum]